jgi:hypothetical protein
MKLNISGNAKKTLAICFIMCAVSLSADARKITPLTLKNGGATVKKTVQPRSRDDADFYALKLRKGQVVEIKVDAKGLFLSAENECSMFFELFDDRGQAVFIGDSMTGIDVWKGEIEKTGDYQIKVAMSCIEGFTAKQLRRKKLVFKYSLTVRVKR